MAQAARTAIAEPANHVYVSTASLWELEIKAALGKLRFDGDLLSEIHAAGMDWLPVQAAHARAAARLPAHHRDPFDRMLIAQAAVEDFTVITHDRIFERYEVKIISA